MNGRRVNARRGIPASAGAAIGVLAVAVWLLSAAGAAADREGSGPSSAKASSPSLTGPARIQPGGRVTFRARGYSPGRRIDVSLSPKRHRGGNCCGVAIRKRFRADDLGRRKLRFRVPRNYSFCAGVSNCSKRKWKPRMKVDVFACNTGDGCALETVRIKRR